WRSAKLLLTATLCIAVIVSVAFWINIQSLGTAVQGFQQPGELKTLGGRKEVWRAAIEMIKERRFLGFGLGTFGSTFPRVTNWDGDLTADAAHNDYLQVLCDTGIVGALIVAAGFLLYFVSIGRLLVKQQSFLSGVALGTFGGILMLLIHS